MRYCAVLNTSAMRTDTGAGADRRTEKSGSVAAGAAGHCQVGRVRRGPAQLRVFGSTNTDTGARIAMRVPRGMGLRSTTQAGAVVSTILKQMRPLARITNDKPTET